MKAPPPLAALLPRDVAMALQQAALTPIPRPDSLVRQIAIEKATERIKAQYPRYFRQEQVNETET